MKQRTLVIVVDTACTDTSEHTSLVDLAKQTAVSVVDRSLSVVETAGKFRINEITL